MPDLSIFKSPAPYHIISYGTLLGTSFFQSFVGGIVSYQALPRPQFSQLQRKLTPVYFGLQTAFTVVLALTYPGSHLLGAPSGLRGTLADCNRWSVLAPLATTLATSIANLVFIGPATTKIMDDRKHQETRDGKKYYGPGPHSLEMEKLNSAFSTMHGMSALLNLVGYIATCWYGIALAERIQ